VEKELPHSYKFRRSGEVKTQVEINIGSFMKFFKIAVPEKTIPFSCEWDEQLGAVVLKEEKSNSSFFVSELPPSPIG